MTPRNMIILGVVKVALLAIAIGVVFSMYGCNTVQGVGKDIKSAGQAIENAGSK